MTFTSVAYAIFLPIIFILYWAVPKTKRCFILLGANVFFYMFGGPAYIILMISIAFVTYHAAVKISLHEEEKVRKRYLAGACIVVLFLLGFFKYADFAAGTVISLLGLFSLPMAETTLKIALPLGISFYSFAAIGYVVDVYRNKISPEKDFIRYFDFVSFFPTVLSGPINRAEDILPLVKEPSDFDYDLAVRGLRQMLWGFFKKLIIADTLALYSDIVFDNATSFFGLTLITATVFYTFQIYCDFSGYSDIATGTAALLGIKVRDNFKSPYYSRSVKEFWSRWHISLSTWFRDYVYIPLGGSRVKEGRHYVNLMITMLLSGLWHGADWSFVIWGGLHGIYQVAEDFCHKHLAPKSIRGMKEKDIKRSTLWNIGHGILTFGLVSFAWSFFRANNTKDAIYIATHMPRGLGHIAGSWVMMLNNMTLDGFKLAWVLILIAVLMAVDFAGRKQDIYHLFGKLPMAVRWIIYVGLTTFIIVMTINGGQTQQFIYFQF